MKNPEVNWSPDSAVALVTKLWAEILKNSGYIPDKSKKISLLQNAQLGSGANLHSHLTCIRTTAIFKGNAEGSWSWHLTYT